MMMLSGPVLVVIHVLAKQKQKMTEKLSRLVAAISWFGGGKDKKRPKRKMIEKTCTTANKKKKKRLTINSVVLLN